MNHWNDRAELVRLAKRWIFDGSSLTKTLAAVGRLGFQRGTTLPQHLITSFDAVSLPIIVHFRR